MGKGVSTAINSVLCQYSGLETDADDMLVHSIAMLEACFTILHAVC